MMLLEVMKLGPKEAAELIRRDCKPWLKEAGDAACLMYRGTSDVDGWFDKLDTRRDRKPTDTPRFVHAKLDDYFHEKFGIRLRSESLHCVGKARLAETYGKVRVVFPIGKYTYVWSPNVKDLYTYIGDEVPRARAEDSLRKAIFGALDEAEYKARDIDEALESGCEIMVDCEFAYYVDNRTQLDDRDYPEDKYGKMYCIDDVKEWI